MTTSNQQAPLQPYASLHIPCCTGAQGWTQLDQSPRTSLGSPVLLSGLLAPKWGPLTPMGATPMEASGPRPEEEGMAGVLSMKLG